MDSAVRRRWLRRIGVLAGLLGLYALIGFLVLPWWARGWLERTLGEQYARPVAIERLAFNPFSLRARAENVVLGDGRGGRQFEVTRIEADYELRSFLSDSRQLSELILERPRLTLVRSAAGAFGGVLGSMVQTMVGDLIPFERRGRASGTIMSAFALSTVAGVPLSLYLANHFGWRFPFVFIAAMAVLLLLPGWKMLPSLRGHLRQAVISETERAHPLSAILAVLRDANHLRALAFMALIMFSGFTVIPYITIYSVANVGIRQEDLYLIYLAGGAATFFTSRLIGRLADRHGKVRIYRLVALCSMAPLLMQTHLVPIPLWLMIVVSTIFFIFVPGRMVPAMAIVTSAVRSELPLYAKGFSGREKKSNDLVVARSRMADAGGAGPCAGRSAFDRDSDVE